MRAPGRASRDPRLAVNQFYAFAVPYVWLANAQQREAGPHMMISDVQRIPATSVDASAKNYHWNDLTMGLLGALDAGADSVVLVDSVGNVVEGPGFNVFCVSHGALVTPSERMLEGVSRRTVIEMARSLGLETQHRGASTEIDHRIKHGQRADRQGQHNPRGRISLLDTPAELLKPSW